MRKFSAGAGLVVALTLGACASTGGGSDRPAAFETYDDCFFARSMTDWRPLDDRNLLVFTGRRQAYQVQLTMRSMGLRFEDRIAFTDRDGRICPYGGDSVVINGALPDRITIASIRRLTESQLEDVYRAYGISVPEVIETPEPSAGEATP